MDSTKEGRINKRNTTFENIFNTKRQLEIKIKKLKVSSVLEKQIGRTKKEEQKQGKNSGFELNNVLEFPKINFAKLPMMPLCNCLMELYNMAHGRAISMHIPPTILITVEKDGYFFHSDERGWLLTEPKFDVKNLLEVVKSVLDEGVAVPGGDQRYILKTYEPTTNSNLAVTYNNKYIMLD